MNIIPFKYLVALILTLIILVYKMVYTFYPINEKVNKTAGKVVFFFLGFSWILVLFDGSHPLVDLIAIFGGILTAYCYSLFNPDEQPIENVTPDDYIGVYGEVLFVRDNEYIGVINHSNQQIQFRSNDQMEKYDDFQIVGFEDGHFIGEKVNNN